MDGDDLVTVARPLNVVNAEILRGKLESEGVECVIFDQNINQAYGATIPAITQMRILVRREDLERAREIMAPLESKRDTGSDNSCPECHSRDTMPVGFLAKVAVVLCLLFSIPLRPSGRPWRCNTCGHRWRTNNGEDLGVESPPFEELKIANGNARHEKY